MSTNQPSNPPAKPKSDIQGVPGAKPGRKTAPDRPFPEILRTDAGRLARKLLAHPEVGVWLGDEGRTMMGLTKLTTYDPKPKE